MDNICLSYEDTHSFEDSVKQFKDNIECSCEKFSKILLNLESELKDSSSKKLLQYGQRICAEIIGVLNPATLILEKVLTIQNMLNSSELQF